MTDSKIYQARYLTSRPPLLDGSLDDPAWRQADIETGFEFPWEDRPAPRTAFRALYDRENLFFAFDVEDDDLVLAQPFSGKEDVTREDRVELFLSLDRELSTYYCLEIDPLGRVLDYCAAYHRQLDFSWSFPGLEAYGCQTPSGYVVQGRLPWNRLEQLGLPGPDRGDPLIVGIYRAEFRHCDDGGWTESWMSWVDPRTPTPDFHVPTSFGRLELVPP